MAAKTNTSPSNIDKTSYMFVAMCGGCHPGGGSLEYDRDGNRYDTYASNSSNNITAGGDNNYDGDYYMSDWATSGVVETDCLMCHYTSDFGWMNRMGAMKNFYKFSYAATVGAGWASFDETGTFTFDYSTAFDSSGNCLVGTLIQKTPDDSKCFSCHNMPDDKKRGRTWSADTDVHAAGGIGCVDCHFRLTSDDVAITMKSDHNFAKGDAMAGSVMDELDDTMYSCYDCHIDGKSTTAPIPKHSELPSLHLEKIACEACHIAYKDEDTDLVQDNATTGLAIIYASSVFLSNNAIDPTSSDPTISSERWYPPLVMWNNKIYPSKPLYTIWWADYDESTKIIKPLILSKIRGLGDSIPTISDDNNDGTAELNTDTEILAFMAILKSTNDSFGNPIATNPVFVKGDKVYYETSAGVLSELSTAEVELPTFSVSHNVLPKENALGAGGCTDCHSTTSVFFFRKILVDPYSSTDAQPVYKNAWEELGYTEDEVTDLTKEVPSTDNGNNGTCFISHISKNNFGFSFLLLIGILGLSLLSSILFTLKVNNKK